MATATRYFEVLGGVVQKPLVLFRFGLLLALFFLLQTAGTGEGLHTAGAALLALALSNVAALLAGERILGRPGFPLLLIALDTLLSTVVILSTGAEAPEVLFLFAAAILVSALGGDQRWVLAGCLGIAAIEFWKGVLSGGADAMPLPALGARMFLLATVGLYIGSLHAGVRQERALRDVDERERVELKTILEIQEAVTSSLALHSVMSAIVRRISLDLGTDRCSVVFLDKDETRGWVLASSDSPDVDMLPIDLAKYPEVRQAMATRSSVLVSDVSTHALMEPVRHHLAGAQFTSLLVVPLIFQDQILGTLLLRAANRRVPFAPAEIEFCQMVAAASVAALKNALLYRDARLESERRRATQDKLERFLDSTGDLVLAADESGRITDYNRVAESVLGHPRERALGRPVTEVLGIGMDCRDFTARLRRAGGSLVESCAIRRADGTRLRLDATFSIFRNDLGEMVGAVCVAPDPARAAHPAGHSGEPLIARLRNSQVTP